MNIILGSASKTRRLLLEEAGIPIAGVLVSGFDEKSIRTNDYRVLPMALAKAKRDAILEKVTEPCFLITGDTVLFYGDRLLEKPVSADEEREFFSIYNGVNRCGFVSAITVTNTETRETREGTSEGEFILGPVTSEEVEAYISGGTYMEYAGGFRYKDPEITPKVVKLDGDLDALMGMPIGLTKQFLTELGYR